MARASLVRWSLLRPCSSQLRGPSFRAASWLPTAQAASIPRRCMATPAAMPSASKPNIGVYCNPEHKLWVEESGPNVEDVRSGSMLKEGEVTIGVKSTGICGYVMLVKLHSFWFNCQRPLAPGPRLVFPEFVANTNQLRHSLLAPWSYRPYGS